MSAVLSKCFPEKPQTNEQNPIGSTQAVQPSLDARTLSVLQAAVDQHRKV
jgi:Na+-transporting methylmalonyl-CoA/oxaloacetate decarboxylase gamma subunit